ncbi:hypothetical protein HYH02_015015 [Chlamydomonas schloesseri]|uniref:Uncharacterized protein n=1 Tax=Chlamydomonas schloesseri TaxID=2026947 RepID=A0A835ST45_9CHLO|nr:hypothetical protein HYH02_015015 [Chlamydomonas schloesseri]|eukprot:KAG2425406.1 hypothetical protein HYH02_015015 [Chlamydomonas schloesseri]
MLQGRIAASSLADIPLLPSRYILGIPLLRGSDVLALSSACSVLLQLGFDAPGLAKGLAGSFVVVLGSGEEISVRKLATSENGNACVILDQHGHTSALALESVLNSDLSEQQWCSVEADYCSRLLAGQADPLTLREVADAFGRLVRLNHCYKLLRNLAAQPAAPTPAASGGSGPAPAAAPPPLVLDAPLRQQLQQALRRPAFSDSQLLGWLEHVKIWEESAAAEMARGRLGQLQEVQQPQPQSQSQPPQQAPVHADAEGGLERRLPAAPRSTAADGRDPRLSSQGAPRSAPTPPAAAAAPGPTALSGAYAAAEATSKPAAPAVAASVPESSNLSSQQAAQDRSRQQRQQQQRSLSSSPSDAAQQGGVLLPAADPAYAVPGPRLPLPCAAARQQQQPQQPQQPQPTRGVVVMEQRWARGLHQWLLLRPQRTAPVHLILREGLGVPCYVLAMTRRQPITFWLGHPELWEYLPGSALAPPALRARPLAPAAPVRDGGGERGGVGRQQRGAATLLGGGHTVAALPQAELRAGAGGPLPPAAAARLEADYIRRLYAFLLKHPAGVAVRDFPCHGIDVPESVLSGRRMTGFLRSYEDVGVLQLNRGVALPVMVRAVRGARAEAALQEACETLLRLGRPQQ